MKLLVFSPYYPPHTGGLETHSEEFNRHLAERGVEIVVFTPRLPMDAPELETTSSIKTIRFPAYEIISNYPLPKYAPIFISPKFLALFFRLWKESPNIIISRTRFFNTSLLALFYAKLKHVPIVHIEHGSDFVQLSNPITSVLAKLYDYTFGRVIFRYSSINISISKAVQVFINRFDKRKSPVIYRGLNFDAIDAISKDASIRKRHPGKIILATAARLYKWKGIENTIEAIRLLSKEMQSQIVFLIIGDGEDFDHLKNSSKNLPIEILGRLSREETIAILKSIDIYIHSSFPGGGLSTSLLEAMYCGCSVIATPNEGAIEIIRHKENGILIQESSPEAIQQALQAFLAKESARESFGEQARNTITENFSWEKSIHAYLDIFKTL